VLTPEQIKAGSLHKTNKAFERYMQSDAAKAKKVYRTANELTRKKGEVIELDKLPARSDPPVTHQISATKNH
jgi:hypothetical protein